MPVITGGTYVPQSGGDVYKFSAVDNTGAAGPVVAGAANVLAATALPAAGTTTVTTFVAQPDYPRNVSIVGNAVGINGTVVVTGLNVAGQIISESIVANGTTPVIGNKAFASFTSIVLPTQNAGGNTISVGFGSKLGLFRRFPLNTFITKMCYLNGAREGTDPTVAVSATNIESNTILLNSALSGTPVYAWFVEPF